MSFCPLIIALITVVTCYSLIPSTLESWFSVVIDFTLIIIESHLPFFIKAVFKAN